jgi:hypothetical protein
MSTSEGSDGYNNIFSELVDDPDDILGIIAYSFYKQQKIEFIQAFRAKHSRPPSEADLNTFYITSNSPASLASYKTKAEALSREFIDAVLGQEIAELKEQSDKELIRRIKSLRPGFWMSVAQNVFASVLFVILLGVVVFVAWSSRFGATQAIEQIMGVHITDTAPAKPAGSPANGP